MNCDNLETKIKSSPEMVRSISDYPLQIKCCFRFEDWKYFKLPLEVHANLTASSGQYDDDDDIVCHLECHGVISPWQGVTFNLSLLGGLLNKGRNLTTRLRRLR